jgi:hypothetical protein
LSSVEPEEKICKDARQFWNHEDNSGVLADHSHWLGAGRWSERTRWFQIGRDYLKMYQTLRLLSGNETPLSHMVEWGPGGGANALAFSSEVRSFYGVDISMLSLKECERQLTAKGFAGFKPVLIPIENPSQCLKAIEGPVQFFLSTAVYQHFPSKEYGIEVTRLAHKMLVENGTALLQIRYDDGRREYRPKRRDYSRNVVTFTSYNLGEFWEICVKIGFTPLAITLNPDINYAYFFLQKNRIIANQLSPQLHPFCSQETLKAKSH